jgi:hypothetical protein
VGLYQVYASRQDGNQPLNTTLLGFAPQGTRKRVQFWFLQVVRRKHEQLAVLRKFIPHSDSSLPTLLRFLEKLLEASKLIEVQQRLCLLYSLSIQLSGPGLRLSHPYRVNWNCHRRRGHDNTPRNLSPSH